MRPETRFVRAGDLYLAYQVLGGGEREIVLAFGGPSHVEAVWDVPELAGFIEQLSDVGRVVIYDKRGVGLSDRVTGPLSAETAADDLVTVVDAAGFSRPVVVGIVDGASIALVAAVRHPDRIRAVVAVEPAPSFVPGGSPWGLPLPDAEMIRRLADNWGSGAMLATASGALSADPRVMASWQRYERIAATPTTARWWLETLLALDVREYLPQVPVPVLVVHARHNLYARVDALRWLADQLPRSRVVELDGDIYEVLLAGGTMLDEAEDFITGTRISSSARRALVALLMTDLVGSTQTLARVGEHAWRRLLEDHRRAVREALRRYEGTEVDTAGDGFLATFRLPSQALRCAVDIRDTGEATGVAVRQGVHAGEITLLDGDIAGQAVHATARIAALGGAGDVVVSDAVLVLATGDHPPAEPLGTRTLRGLPGRWRLHRLVTPPSAGSGA